MSIAVSADQTADEFLKKICGKSQREVEEIASAFRPPIRLRDRVQRVNAFYALRAGVNLGLGGMNLDVYGAYQFWTDDDLKTVTGEDLDSVTSDGLLL